MKSRLYDEYIKRLLCVNDETKTPAEHNRIIAKFQSWKQGVEDAKGFRFNGDNYYIPLFESGEMKNRPICCGIFLDWKSVEEILPCPFCNGKDIRFNCYKDHNSPTREIWSICCYDCGAHFPNRYKKELLLTAWNKRYYGG